MLVSLPRNGSDGIPRFISILYCMERNSELYSLPRNGSERNSENLLYFGSTEKSSLTCSVNQLNG
jgi:hypothetical protein